MDEVNSQNGNFVEISYDVHQVCEVFLSDFEFDIICGEPAQNLHDKSWRLWIFVQAIVEEEWLEILICFNMKCQPQCHTAL